MGDEINFWTIAQDIGAISTLVFIPLVILLQIIKGINYFPPRSVEWWMVMGLVLIMIKSNVRGLEELDRLKKYLKHLLNIPIINELVVKPYIKKYKT